MIDSAKLDEAAEFMLSVQNPGALWSRMPEHLKERYRDKVRHILLLCGVEPAAWAVKG